MDDPGHYHGKTLASAQAVLKLQGCLMFEVGGQKARAVSRTWLVCNQ